MTPRTLADIENALRASWAAAACSPDDLARADWSGTGSARGHSDITALVVNDFLGGGLVVGDVYLRGEHRGHHWWNRLPGGMEIDLTRGWLRQG